MNSEYENNKQKLETLVTERTDITPILGMDLMKRFRLTIRRFQLAEIKQSRKERIFHILIPLHLQGDVGKELEKLIKAGHLGKVN